jgi:hypothetical protein
MRLTQRQRRTLLYEKYGSNLVRTMYYSDMFQRRVIPNATVRWMAIAAARGRFERL